MLNDAEKVEALERILKALTRAEEIVYPVNHAPDVMLNRIEFRETDPEDFRFKGYSEGLDVSWDAEIYEDDWMGERRTFARMVATVWVERDYLKYYLEHKGDSDE